MNNRSVPADCLDIPTLISTGKKRGEGGRRKKYGAGDQQRDAFWVFCSDSIIQTGKKGGRGKKKKKEMGRELLSYVIHASTIMEEKREGEERREGGG